jgi:deoxyribonuclease IV
MSLIGIDISTYEDMFEMNKNRDIKLFQISARYLSNYLEKVVERGETLDMPDNFKVVVHYSYSINLAHNWKESDWWIQQLITEIESADRIGAFALVIHTGKSMQYSVSAAINNMFSSLLYVHGQTSKSSVKLLIETPAGQGTELLSDIQNFTNFIKKFDSSPELSERFGICIDTCHIYSAGYDISQKKGISEFFDSIDKEVGISKIKLVHLNNSRSELGSAVDRHDNLKSGTLSMKSIGTIIKFINALGIPMVLETPAGDSYELILKDLEIMKDVVRN